MLKQEYVLHEQKQLKILLIPLLVCVEFFCLSFARRILFEEVELATAFSIWDRAATKSQLYN